MIDSNNTIQQIMKQICHMCGTETAEVVVIPELEVTWGSPDTEFGTHTFTIYNDELYECTICGEGYYTYDQSRSHEEKMNEWIKANLGIDWLARNKQRRALKRNDTI